MQFLTIKRRGGEEIPINPLQVCYVRQVGAVTIVAMANGHEHRIQVPAAELVAALEHAADVSPSSKRATVLEPPAPGAENTPPSPADGAPAAEPDPEDEEEARKQAAGSRQQEADGDHAHAGEHNRGGVKK